MSAFNTLSKASSAVQTRVGAYGLANYKKRCEFRILRTLYSPGVNFSLRASQVLEMQCYFDACYVSSDDRRYDCALEKERRRGFRRR